MQKCVNQGLAQRRKSSKSSLDLRLEQLESRDCPSVFYDFQVLAQTGGPQGFTSLGNGPSINDNGYVAFVGRTQDANGKTVENVYTVDPQTQALYKMMNPAFELPNSGEPANLFFPQVELSNTNQVLARRRQDTRVQVGFPFGSILTAPLTYLEKWDATKDFSQQPSGQKGLPVETVAMGDGGAGAAGGLLTFLNPVTGGIWPSPFDINSAFAGFFNWSSQNNHGDVVGGAILSNAAGGGYALVKPTSSYSYAKFDTNNVRPAPMIADDGTVVFRDADKPGPIIVLDSNLSKVDEIDDADGFTNLGIPSISDDGQIITFAGVETRDVDGDGVTGPGIFARVKHPAGLMLFGRLASTSDDISSFTLSEKISVSNINSGTQSALFVFEATNTSGQTGLYRSQLKINTNGVSFLSLEPGKPSSIIHQGETLSNLGVVNNLSIHDSENNNGDIVFWVGTSGGEAIVKTQLPTQRVVLAWGEPVPVSVVAIRTTNDFIYPHFPGTMPAYTATAGFQEAVRAHVEQQFRASGIDRIEVVNEIPGPSVEVVDGVPQMGATVVYFTNPINNRLGGLAYSGGDRFNSRLSDGVVVMVQGDVEKDAETITHEVGHSLGLRHIDPPGDLEVMDYDSVSNNIEVFTNQPFQIKEPPNSLEPGAFRGITHNPAYHLKRHVEGISESVLNNENTLPGYWDLRSNRVDDDDNPLKLIASLRNGADPDNYILYQVYILEEESVGDGMQTLAYYDSISLADLSSQTFTFTQGHALQLFAASTPGGFHDISLATGDPSSPDNTTIFPAPGSHYFLQLSNETTGEYTTLADVAIVIPGMNNSPISVNDTAVAPYATSVSISVLANDSDPDGDMDPTTVAVVGAPAHGTVVVDPVTGVIAYTPAAGFIGNDSFTYLVSDLAGNLSNTALVTIAVGAPPTAGRITAKVARNGSLSINGDALGNGIAIMAGAAPGSLILTGLGTTTINNRASVTVTGVTGNISIQLGSGNDVLLFGGNGPLVLQRQLAVALGDGADLLRATNLSVGNASFQGGNGNDFLFFGETTFRGTLEAVLGAGMNQWVTETVKVAGRTTIRDGSKVTLRDTQLASALRLALSDGNNTVVGEHVTVGGKASIRGGKANDKLRFSHATFRSEFEVDLCEGMNELVAEDVKVLSRSTVRGGGDITLQDAQLAALLVVMGSGHNALRIENTNVLGKTVIEGGRNADTIDILHSTFRSTFQLSSNAGSDAVKIVGSTFSGKTLLDGGTGTDALDASLANGNHFPSGQLMIRRWE